MTTHHDNISAPASASVSASVSTESSTSDLTRAIQAGDLQAEDILVRRFTRGLQIYLRVRLGCPREWVEDLYQDSFRVALERLRGRGIAEPEAFAGFLRGIARQLLLNEQRRQARRRTDTDEEALASTLDHRPGPLSGILDVEAGALVRTIIHKLETPRDREILHRFYIAEDPKESICQDLGLATLNFNLVLFRARQKFKDLWEDFQQEESPALHTEGAS